MTTTGARDAPARGADARRPFPAAAAVVAVALVALDQLTKSLALEHLSGRAPLELFWTLQLRLSFNSGAAFGLGRGLTPVLIAVGVCLLIALVFMIRSATSRVSQVGLGMVVGGAVGNLADRVFRDHGGAVIDFIDFQWWPVFNVADIAISLGAILLVLFSNR